MLSTSWYFPRAPLPAQHPTAWPSTRPLYVQSEHCCLLLPTRPGLCRFEPHFAAGGAGGSSGSSGGGEAGQEWRPAAGSEAPPGPAHPEGMLLLVPLVLGLGKVWWGGVHPIREAAASVAARWQGGKTHATAAAAACRQRLSAAAA